MKLKVVIGVILIFTLLHSCSQKKKYEVSTFTSVFYPPCDSFQLLGMIEKGDTSIIRIWRDCKVHDKQSSNIFTVYIIEKNYEHIKDAKIVMVEVDTKIDSFAYTYITNHKEVEKIHQLAQYNPSYFDLVLIASRILDQDDVDYLNVATEFLGDVLKDSTYIFEGNMWGILWRYGLDCKDHLRKDKSYMAFFYLILWMNDMDKSKILPFLEYCNYDSNMIYSWYEDYINKYKVRNLIIE